MVAAIFVVTFLEIHPFQDGNGRLSRLLTILLLLKSGYAYVPYASLENVIENNKEDYYLALRQTQETIRSNAPNWQPWLLFFFVFCSNKNDDYLQRLSAIRYFLLLCQSYR
ncbi:MAG: Fic family protein [Methylocystis sp.]